MQFLQVKTELESSLIQLESSLIQFLIQSIIQLLLVQIALKSSQTLIFNSKI